jgi:hypothetical protein
MPVLNMDNVDRLLRGGDGARVDVDITPRFKVGDLVLARNFQTMGHTRLPRYARSRRGVIALAHGVFVFPDTNALNGEREPQYLYSVMFTMRELWGDGASALDGVHIDLFDD